MFDLTASRAAHVPAPAPDQSNTLSRLERVEYVVGRMELAVGRLELAFSQMRMETAQTSVRHETHVNESIEKIKRGMDEFFSCYAAQVENEAAQNDEASQGERSDISEIEETASMSGSPWNGEDTGRQ
ncbi:hypothetical protein B0T14DRAFT_501966 [Immersiella caudata]|uniref:Uncharacterized protein n=1 Tax=Immersiella caudata TaxID=314043 RepID=A0AA39XCV8_9PEZI|nr:hypothetical protein B0T14DRAFT_501966 [Immersiella caudata]